MRSGEVCGYKFAAKEPASFVNGPDVPDDEGLSGFASPVRALPCVPLYVRPAVGGGIDDGRHACAIYWYTDL